MKLQLMQELLREAEEARTFDVQEIVKTFKNKTEIEKHLRKLWGSHHLTFKGQPFFVNEQDGPVIKKAKKAADSELKGEIEVDLSYKNEGDMFEMAVDESKLVYMGYSENNDMLYLGYDVWMNTEEIEEAFSKLYGAVLGEEPDEDDEKFIKEWKTWNDKNQAFIGALVEVSSTDGKTFNADLLHTEPNGFYHGTVKSQSFKRMKLIDLMHS